MLDADDDDFDATAPAEPSAVDALRATLDAASAGRRLDLALARALPEHSRSRLQGWIRSGRVRVDDRVVDDPTAKVWGGEAVQVEAIADPASAAALPEAIALDIVHEDDALLVVDKPAGLVVHPASGNWTGTLLNALIFHRAAQAGLPRAGIVHRLDKDTSGLMVVAKTATAQTALVRQLQARTVKREYLAIVHGKPQERGTIDAPIGRDPQMRTRMGVTPGGKPARTHYRLVETLAHGIAAVVRCSLETGRTHQIRVHMRSIGHPLVGDPIYGRRTRGLLATIAAFPRQALHATRLALVHPESGTEISWERPWPADLAALHATLGGGGG